MPSHKKQVILSLVILILLIITSSFLGWIMTRYIEESEQILQKIHQLKETELEIRRQEKNLLIRGFLEDEFEKLKNAKQNFENSFNELKKQDALSDEEIKNITECVSEMNTIFDRFLADIKIHKLHEDETFLYDEEFKKIGRKTIAIIDEIVVKKQAMAEEFRSISGILIIILSFIFVVVATLLAYYIIRQI